MTLPQKGFALTVLAGLLLGSGHRAPAEQIRFRYTPVDAAGNTSLVPASANSPVGQRVTFLGALRRPYINQPRPTHLVTFRHPYTGREVTVPLALPEGTPRVEYRPSRVIYNYGSYTVEAHFFPDGAVDVVYDNGLLRRF